MLFYILSQIINEEIITGVKKSFKPEGSYQWNLSGRNLRPRPEKWHVIIDVFLTNVGMIIIYLIKTISYKKTYESHYEWLRVTTNDYEWLRVRLRMTTSDYEWLRVTTSDYEWLRMTTSDYELLRVTTSDYEWLRVTTSNIFDNYSAKVGNLLFS